MGESSVTNTGRGERKRLQDASGTPGGMQVPGAPSNAIPGAFPAATWAASDRPSVRSAVCALDHGETELQESCPDCNAPDGEQVG